MLNTSKRTNLKFDNELSLRRCFYFQTLIWKVVSDDIGNTSEASVKLGIPFSCASCEYDEQGNNKGDCKDCPSTSIWTIGLQEKQDIECAEFKSCPYAKWNANKYGTYKGTTKSSYDAQFFALLISDESKRLLQENL